jgi:hypothetical protein
MSKIGTLRDLLVALLHEHEQDGTIPTNARFLYYELVQRGQLNKEKTGARRSDQDMHDALTDIREDGRIPWDWLVDETRSIEDYTGYDSIEEGVIAKLPYIELDPWNGNAPLILTESRSLAGVLRHVANKYRARIASTNGQVGGFLHTDIAPMLWPGARVLYLGDEDLCGNQIENNTRRVLEQIVGPLKWERLALTETQVKDYKLPVIMKKDRRYKGGREHPAVETEAISQRILIEILEARLKELLPEPLEDVQEREEEERKRITKLFNQ